MGEFAAAVGLAVEAVLRGECQAPLEAVALLEVLLGEGFAADFPAGLEDRLAALVRAYGERGREGLEAMFPGVGGGAGEVEGKAAAAARAALGLVFEPLRHLFKPLGVGGVRVLDEGRVRELGEPFGRVAPPRVFLLRRDVCIGEEERDGETRLPEAFDAGGGAGPAADVKKDSGHVSG